VFPQFLIRPHGKFLAEDLGVMTYIHGKAGVEEKRLDCPGVRSAAGGLRERVLDCVCITRSWELPTFEFHTQDRARHTIPHHTNQCCSEYTG